MKFEIGFFPPAHFSLSPLRTAPSPRGRLRRPGSLPWDGPTDAPTRARGVPGGANPSTLASQLQFRTEEQTCGAGRGAWTPWPLRGPVAGPFAPGRLPRRMDAGLSCPRASAEGPRRQRPLSLPRKTDRPLLRSPGFSPRRCPPAAPPAFIHNQPASYRRRPRAPLRLRARPCFTGRGEGRLPPFKIAYDETYGRSACREIPGPRVDNTSPVFHGNPGPALDRFSNNPAALRTSAKTEGSWKDRRTIQAGHRGRCATAPVRPPLVAGAGLLNAPLRKPLAWAYGGPQMPARPPSR